MKQLKKRLRSCAAAAAACTVLMGAANAAQVVVDGSPLYTASYISQNRTYVPIRDLYEALGCSVRWDSLSRSATITTADGSTITIADGQYGIINNARLISADTRNRVTNGKLCAPVRAVAESMDFTVEWTGSAALLTRQNEDQTGPETQTPSAPQTKPDTQTPSYTESELYWLARIIYAEAGGESMEGMIAVGNTILNRVESDLYPDTIYDVIFDRKYTVQYEPVLNGTIYNTPSEEAYEAARRCLEGENVVGDCLFFLNPRKATNFWIVNNRDFYRTIGNHDFYL